ncbi:hypothetical protein [Winogradskyella alexanderae]|uniref:Methyltransferase FkbM domain-containing protein n=1 Tax=Winogradskyella alexanderae TaxID=2877123 RepID=A0ABS7XUS1_9FLAO|nr:hypothetical protein [Winogradskyella alexanderae]MCA0133530.1 hypothetical protein [Winogradskyella alexanderae]
MKKIIKRSLVSFLEKKGFLMARVTERKKIIELIESLRPINVQNELIRLGPKGDGGYLVPDDLENIEACFSPGVDKISEFELECLKRGMKIFLADKSVEKPNFNLPEDKFDFIKMFVGCTTNDDFITMDDWVSIKCQSDNSDLLLQMDIEGSEYNSLINMSNHLMNRFRIMVIEFHSLQDLWNPHFFNLNQTVFDKILQTHICVHIHPNNCCGIYSRYGIEIPRVAEFTFLRKDRVTSKTYANRFPHHLDYDNTDNEPISLPKIWYRNI